MNRTITMSCSCGAGMTYIGRNVAAERDAFLEAHRTCRSASFLSRSVREGEP